MAYWSLGRVEEGVQEKEVPLWPAGIEVSIRRHLTRTRDVLTGDGGDGLEVGAGAVLQSESNGARGIRPGDLEGLTSLDVEVGVGKLNSLGQGSEAGDEDRGEALHCDGLGCFSKIK